jgi:hypothetical protein
MRFSSALREEIPAIAQPNEFSQSLNFTAMKPGPCPINGRSCFRRQPKTRFAIFCSRRGYVILNLLTLFRWSASTHILNVTFVIESIVGTRWISIASCRRAADVGYGLSFVADERRATLTSWRELIKESYAADPEIRYPRDSFRLEIAVGLKQLFELVERLFRIWVGTAWGKGALVLIVGGVLSITSIVQYVIPPVAKAFGITITIPDTPTWLSLTLIILGILLLVMSQLIPDLSKMTPPTGPPNPHDVRLLAEYRVLVTPELIRFLTEHSFKHRYRVAILDPLEVIAYDWVGAHYEFFDADLQQSLTNVIGAGRGLCGVITNCIFLMMQTGMPVE